MTKKVATKTKELARPNAFIGRSAKPRDADVAAALGGAKKLWDRIIRELEEEFELTHEWNSFSVKYGWSLRMKKKDRNIVYLGPYDGGFAASLILGAKALAAARRELSAAVFAGAKKYPEGTAVRVEMLGEKDLQTVKKLVMVKLAG